MEEVPQDPRQVLFSRYWRALRMDTQFANSCKNNEHVVVMGMHHNENQ